MRVHLTPQIIRSVRVGTDFSPLKKQEPHLSNVIFSVYSDKSNRASIECFVARTRALFRLSACNRQFNLLDTTFLFFCKIMLKSLDADWNFDYLIKYRGYILEFYKPKLGNPTS